MGEWEFRPWGPYFVGMGVGLKVISSLFLRLNPNRVIINHKLSFTLQLLFWIDLSWFVEGGGRCQICRKSGNCSLNAS